VRPFAGAGLGLHFFKGEVDIPAQDMGTFIIPAVSTEDTSTKIGMDIGGGVSTTLNEKTELLGEAWYGIVSDINQFSLRVGILYKLGI
jgi:opacity protein-like surface antigen